MTSWNEAHRPEILIPTLDPPLQALLENLISTEGNPSIQGLSVIFYETGAKYTNAFCSMRIFYIVVQAEATCFRYLL
jgi:hypothetical protein